MSSFRSAIPISRKPFSVSVFGILMMTWLPSGFLLTIPNVMIRAYRFRALLVDWAWITIHKPMISRSKS